MSPEALASALRLRARIGFRGEGKRGMYLCHSFCELGATPLADGLDDIHQFLVTHPGEVVVVVNQDYVTPADFVKAIGAAGLTRYAATLGPGPLPTLRSMVDSDRRLVLLAENHAGAASWYQLAYESLAAGDAVRTSTARRSCSPPGELPAQPRPRERPAVPAQPLGHHRAGAAAQRRREGQRVRARCSPARATCERIRKRLPNLLAVELLQGGRRLPGRRHAQPRPLSRKPSRQTSSSARAGRRSASGSAPATSSRRGPGLRRDRGEQPLEPGVDRLAAALDQPVGVEEEAGPGRQGERRPPAARRRRAARRAASSGRP